MAREKTDRAVLEKRIDELYEMIIKCKSVEDCRDLFSDLCTFKEIEKMAQRVYGAKLFLEGKTYNQIIAETELSSATLARISRCLLHGNGYLKFVDREKIEREKSRSKTRHENKH